MKITISTETIKPMIKICERLLEKENVMEELEKLLEHEDYQIEFERYDIIGGGRGGFSKEEFIQFFTHLHELKYEDVDNTRLKMRLERYQYFLNNLDMYKEKIEMLEVITEEKVLKALEKTVAGLPNSVDFSDLKLIFSIGMGNSGGWFYKNYSHYDVIIFLENFNEEVMLNTIAHEYHHVGINMLLSRIEDGNGSMEENFYRELAFEGLAIKYCNNYKGILTKSIFDEAVNIGLDDNSYRYYVEEFEDVYKNFISDIMDTRSGKINNEEEFTKRFWQYWMSTRSKRVKDNEPDDLSQSLNYFLGGDIWGLIHDVYGKDKVYELFENPKEFASYYNKALKTIGRMDLEIPELE
ncbi:MAG: DUF5700 domain-containing putative Zn-dependent protease [Clostridium sp.]